jgi:hypothetical protein
MASFSITYRENVIFFASYIALWYNPEGHGFGSRRHLIFVTDLLVQALLWPWQFRVQRTFLGVKCGRQFSWVCSVPLAKLRNNSSKHISAASFRGCSLFNYNPIDNNSSRLNLYFLTSAYMRLLLNCISKF